MRYLNVLYVRDDQHTCVQVKLDSLSIHTNQSNREYPIRGKWYQRDGYAYYLMFSLTPMEIFSTNVDVFTYDQTIRRVFHNGKLFSELHFSKFMTSIATLNFSVMQRIEIWKALKLFTVPDDIQVYSNILICDYEKFVAMDIDLKKLLVIGASELKITKYFYVARIVTIDNPVITLASAMDFPLIIKDLSGDTYLFKNGIRADMDDLSWIEDEVAKDMVVSFASKKVM